METIQSITLIAELFGGIALVIGVGTLIGHLLRLDPDQKRSQNDLT